MALSQLNPDRNCKYRLGGKKNTGVLLNDPILTPDLATSIDNLFPIYRDETICNAISQLSNQHGQYLNFVVVYSPGQWLYSF